ncbi:hypothetical protein S13b_00006 [Klebsiella phage VLCpiS13b]|uniref:hypothetical protein n=1 Tax=Klebsiella phage VLCpiS13b TaxID=2874886 RepID=UPI00233E7A7D|nr:hypothetical protein PRB92_gp06 [Klebsiella phage VLCpiS13b]UVX30583.1 hypothetical protein S13b_00006 [Klebsiella phage VLCpiS13b]
MNTRQRYRMGYCGWLKKTVGDFLSKRVLADAAYGLLLLLLILSFPLSMPIVAVIRMVTTKRSLRKQYGHDELNGD